MLGWILDHRALFSLRGHYRYALQVKRQIPMEASSPWIQHDFLARSDKRFDEYLWPMMDPASSKCRTIALKLRSGYPCCLFACWEYHLLDVPKQSTSYRETLG